MGKGGGAAPGELPGPQAECQALRRRVYESCPQLEMVICLLVLPSLEPQRSMASTTFIPSLTRPKTTCLPSNLHRSVGRISGAPPPLRGHRNVTPCLPPSPHSPLGLGSADEELGAVRVGAGVGHGQDAGPRVLQDEVLVGKLLPVNGFATSAVVARKVTTLKKYI